MASRISLPQLCPASWADMTPAPGGRHCAACNKVVVDFSTLSGEEITRQLRDTAAAVCALVRPSALNASANLLHPMPATPSVRPPFYIQGQVVDATTALGVGGATVEIQNTPYGVYTDAKGYFNFQLAASWRSCYSLTLVVSQIYGYKSRRISLPLVALRPLRVRLQALPEDTLLGYIVEQDRLLPPPVE